ncbi:MAG: thiamine pyrophosphate-dependent dehydrogenase E1 component subunit alpha [Alicyclobacillus sp.]|nr:thiamine pyrophosphate-dependent dehydrogenase E1 component subunit alpha [Alicyclobacillus sp.]
MQTTFAKGRGCVEQVQIAFYIELYRKMKLIRRFEEEVRTLVNQNRIAGVTHEYIGEEAVAVGVCSALREDDVITSTHRGHGHIIAKGGDVRRMMAELFGRVTGYNLGRGGSMHIADLSLGIFGANGIVAAGVPIAAGAALASQYRGADSVAVAFFGDGASNQGVLHETMNLSAIWNLPVIFVCENNGYAVSTPISEMLPVPTISSRAAAYGFPGETVDGMDVLAVYRAAEIAVQRARSGGGPTLLEFQTYRYVGHHTAEETQGLNYRTQDEIESWRKRDPIEYWSAWLSNQGIWSESTRSEIDAGIEALIAEAVQYADSSPWPAPEDALEHMYVRNYEGLPARGEIS